MMLAAMGAVEWIVIAVAAAIVIFTVVAHIFRKKKGKNACGCDCSGCAYGGSCPSAGGKKPKDPKEIDAD